MSKPWEDTIVLALRDIQWMGLNVQGAAAPALPGLFIKLDGNTEKTLGDLMYQEGENFYLFEVKSTRASISSEWSKKDKNGARKQKAAYKVLSKLVGEWLKDGGKNSKWDGALMASLKCHHFVYWSDDVFAPNDTFGNIMIEPYIGASMALGGEPNEEMGTLMPTCEPKFEVGILHEGARHFDVSEMLPFSALRSGSAHALRVSRSSGVERVVWVEKFGANIDDFKNYLRFICENAGEGGEIYAVVVSDFGRFTRVVSSISELKRLVKESGNSMEAKTSVLKTRKVPAKNRRLHEALAAAGKNKSQLFPFVPGVATTPNAKKK